jgi:hypothetical protein
MIKTWMWVPLLFGCLAGPAVAGENADIQIVFKKAADALGAQDTSKLVCSGQESADRRCKLTKEKNGQTIETVSVSKTVAEKLVKDFFKTFSVKKIAEFRVVHDDPVLMDYEVAHGQKVIKGSIHSSILKGDGPVALAPVLMLQAQLESRLQ